MQRTHQNTINSKSEIHISVLAPDLDLTDNIGGLFRICDAMGVEQIYFGNQVDLNARKLKKAARSTQKHLDCVMNVDSEQIVKECINQNYLVIGLELTETSIPMQQLNLDEYTAVLLVIGNEIQGISEQLLSEIPQCYHINMYGVNSSINVIQATSIALYQIQSCGL